MLRKILEELILIRKLLQAIRENSEPVPCKVVLDDGKPIQSLMENHDLEN